MYQKAIFSFTNERVAIVSQNSFFALGLQHFLYDELGCKFVVIHSSIKEFFSDNHCKDFDVVVFNNDVISGYEFHSYALFNGLLGCSKCIFIGDIRVSLVNMLMRSFGAVAFLLNNDDLEEIVRALNFLYTERTYSSRLFNEYLRANTAGDENSLEQITPREHEVLNLLCHGHDTDTIASLLNISPRTVVRHKTNLMQKTGAVSTLHMVTSFLNPTFTDTISYPLKLQEIVRPQRRRVL